MIINDVHHHVALSPSTLGNDYSFDVFLRERGRVKGATALFILPNRQDLYPCPPDHHFRVVPQGVRGLLRFECCNCGIVSYEGSDPFRDENRRLIDLCRQIPNVFPYIYLTLCNNTISDELAYFSEEYDGLFYGLKVHPNLCCKRISEIRFNSGYPIVIHAGMQPEDDPDDIVKFAERYEGNVLIAHMARCSITALRRIKEIPNAYIDTSPTYLTKQICGRVTSRYYRSELFDVSSETEVYNRLIDLVGPDKIVFGTDAPFGSMEEAVDVYNRLDIPWECKQAIFESNFIRFNRRTL